MTLKGNAIVAQSGGPSAVINNSICGVIQTWLAEAPFGTIYAGIAGVKGILDGDIIDLALQDAEKIAGLRHTPGAGIFSCRYKVTDDDQRRLVQILKEHDIRYFFYNGGNDSMDTAHKTWLAAQEAGWEMRVIGVPKTIDNDLPFIDHCPGFGSAAKYIATTVRETGIDLESVSTKNKVTILEAMGRDAGWLTGASVLSRRFPDEAPHLIYLPEVPFDKQQFIADVKKVYDELGYCYVVVSEGIRDKNGDYCFAAGSVDAFGHKQLSGVGVALKDLVEAELGISARCNTLGTAQRSAMHCASRTDAEEAYLAGQTAVRYALADKSGIMVTLERAGDEPYKCVCGETPLANVANLEKKVPREWINEAGNYVTEDFVRYVRPLVQGEAPVPMKDGLPDYVRLDFSKGRLK
ncbi:MAG: 6-phosphofructokinase [Firmicutes bacterium]|nr:6-phosphofructokinase [Bacillota bacterium]